MYARPLTSRSLVATGFFVALATSKLPTDGFALRSGIFRV